MDKVQHMKWCMKQTKLTSEISCPTDLLLSSVGIALASWSGVPGFNPLWGQFLTNCFFALPCVKICLIFWQKRLSWKTQLAMLHSPLLKLFPLLMFYVCDVTLFMYKRSCGNICFDKLWTSVCKEPELNEEFCVSPVLLCFSSHRGIWPSTVL